MEQKAAKPATINLADAKLRYAALPDKQRSAVYRALGALATINGRRLTKYDLDTTKAQVDIRGLGRLDSLVSEFRKKTPPTAKAGSPGMAGLAAEAAATKKNEGLIAWYMANNPGVTREQAVEKRKANREYAAKGLTLGEELKAAEQDLGIAGAIAGQYTPLGAAIPSVGRFIGEQVGYIAATPATIVENVEFFLDPEYRAKINPQGTSAADYTGAALKLWLNVGAPGAGRILSPALKAAGTTLEKAGVKLVESGSLLGKPILQAKLAKEINTLEFGKELVKHGVPAKEASRAAYFATRAFQQSSAEDLDLAFSRYKIEQKALPGPAEQLALPEVDPLRQPLRETADMGDLQARLQTAPEQAIPPGGYFTEPAVTPDAPTPVPKKVDKPLSEAPIKGTQESTPTKTPLEPQKPVTGQPGATEGGTVGLAKRFEGTVLPRRPTNPVDESVLADKAKKMVDSGELDPQEILDRVAKGGQPTMDDVAAVTYRLAQNSDHLDDVMALPEGAEKINALTEYRVEMERIADFSEKSRKAFHGLGMAHQITYNPKTMEFKSLREQAMAHNFFNPISKKVEDRLTAASNAYKTARSGMSEATKAAKEAAKKLKPPRGSAEALRSSALSRLRKLGIDAREPTVATGGFKSKQAGALGVEQRSVREQRYKAIRDLVRSYVKEGTTDFDSVVKSVLQDVPGIGYDDVIEALSPSMRQFRTDAMIASREAQRAMTKVRHQAEFRIKSSMDKGLTVASDLAKNVQRSIQASYDISAGLLQGKAALLARPGSWLKSWGTVAKALAAHPMKADEVSERIFADLLSDPVIKEAYDQGWLDLRGPHGGFTPQEEIFGGHIAHRIPGIARSEAAFNGMLNAMYADWYRKLASVDPGNAKYKQEVASMINVFSGRGTGKVAEMLGNPAYGWAGFAPKYAWSLVQTGTGYPLMRRGLTMGARKEARKAYAAMMASAVAITKMAPLFGYEVDTDIRSTKFGTMRFQDGREYDAYNKITQIPRLMAQMAYGRIGARGQYKAPGEWGNEPLTDYLEGNFSPAIRDVLMIFNNKIYDKSTKEYRAVTPEDYIWVNTPLAAQDIFKSGNDVDTVNVIAAMLGGRPSKADTEGLKSGEKEAPPLKLKLPAYTQSSTGRSHF